MSDPVIECREATKRYGSGTPAVDRASFALYPGEILSILGPSGCGKTTTLRLIAGFERPDEGEVRIRGGVVSGPSVHVPPDRRNVGMVFQEYALFPHKTVAENVTFGLHRLAAHERERRLAEVIDLVRLNGLEGRYPHELSGGQQQRVALARTIAPRPIAVLLDEPFSNLDVAMRREMRRELVGILRENSIATIFVTHDREEAFAIADRIGVMRDGRLEQMDAPDVIYHSPATPFVAKMAGTSDFIAAEVHDGLAVTEVGRLPFTSSNGILSNGSRMVLLVHLDDFQVIPHDDGPSTVRAREFLGDSTVLEIELPSGATLRCRQRSYSPLATGARVALVPVAARAFLAFSEP